MAKKKLQIFISSTYLDLEEERQAAVEAILGSKHIPAGMELFRAGNTSQWDTIKRWINESDMYMLILGGRYGSIEPQSGKSYTQLEYEYAIDNNIPVFTVILKDEFLLKKAVNLTKEKVFEDKNKHSYNEFKKFVQTKTVRYAEDCKDIKLAIKDSVSQLEEDYELVGWIRSNEGDTGTLLQQLNEARVECDKLRSELEECKSQIINNSSTETLASGDEKVKVEYFDSSSQEYTDFVELTWNNIFVLLGNVIYKYGCITQDQIQEVIERETSRVHNIDYDDIEVHDEDLIKIEVQLEKLNLIKRVTNKLAFMFTEPGKEEFYNNIVDKKQS